MRPRFKAPGSAVDFSQRKAPATPSDEGPDDQVESVIRFLQERMPQGFRTGGGDAFQVSWGDPVGEKRLRDLLRDATAGREHPAVEDAATARLAQARPETVPIENEFHQNVPEWALNLARGLNRGMENEVGFMSLRNPEIKAKFIQDYARSMANDFDSEEDWLMGQKRKKPRSPAQPEADEPTLTRGADDKFWGATTKKL